MKRSGLLYFSRISLASSAQASNARLSERTRVLSQSNRICLIYTESCQKFQSNESGIGHESPAASWEFLILCSFGSCLDANEGSQELDSRMEEKA